MPAPGTFWLDIYDDDGESILWTVSTDPDADAPYLLKPSLFGAQEIDPVRGGATLGTVEVAVADAPQTPGDQQSGWMTERLADVRGHRARLRHYLDGVAGYITIMDGQCGTPVMDPSYAAYRWTVSDGRERERRLALFRDGFTTALIPRGPINGFGQSDDEGWLIDPVTPVSGELAVGAYGALTQGVVTLFDGDPDTDPIPSELVVSKVVEALLAGAFATHPTLGDVTIFPNADILWREGADPWSQSRPMVPASGVFLTPAFRIEDGFLADGTQIRFLQSVILFVDESAPDGFPTDGTTLDLLIRHRGPASADVPFYFEGTLGELLAAGYDGLLTHPPAVEGDRYDPMGLDDAALIDFPGTIPYDLEALSPLAAPVLLRQTDVAEDGRDWFESRCYAPSGWLPTLDWLARIAPQRRGQPADLSSVPELNADNCEPSSQWDAGERVVTAATVTSKRYYLPPPELFVATEPDGLAVKDVSYSYEDVAASARHGRTEETFDAIPFASRGTVLGESAPYATETAATLAAQLNADLLPRYTPGAESFAVAVLRSAFTGVPRPGDWVTLALDWLPGESGRGAEWDAGHILSVSVLDRDWLQLLVERVQAPFYGPLEISVEEVESDDDDLYRAYEVAVADPKPGAVDSITLRAVAAGHPDGGVPGPTIAFTDPSGIEDGVGTGTPTNNLATTGKVTVQVERPAEDSYDQIVQFIATRDGRGTARGAALVPKIAHVFTPGEIVSVAVGHDDGADTVSIVPTLSPDYSYFVVEITASGKPTLTGSHNQTDFDLGFLYGWDLDGAGANTRGYTWTVRLYDEDDNELDSASDSETLQANDDY